MSIDKEFRERFWEQELPRPDDERDDYQRDKSRIIHSAAFRRLQSKTQVMGIGEGDFHRTRLTHSLEVAQVGEGILGHLKRKYGLGTEINNWLPTVDLVAAACYAHDLGHPPFGHGGEHALHERMAGHGGFEGNGQTLRILTRLEKYRQQGGVNPTRRLLLAILKYPIAYSKFDPMNYKNSPPKCYFDTESKIIEWVIGAPFSSGEAYKFTNDRDMKDKPVHRSLDCSLMECADDIAYGVHDLEDIVARKLVNRDDFFDAVKNLFNNIGKNIGVGEKAVRFEDFEFGMFGESYERKQLIGKLVNLFITSTRIESAGGFIHPLLRYRVVFENGIHTFLEGLKKIPQNLVILTAAIQQLERRGQRIVAGIFDELSTKPKNLIPESSWNSLDQSDSEKRRVCDYVAGMTDPYASRIYNRLFVPGIGSSRDEL